MEGSEADDPTVVKAPGKRGRAGRAEDAGIDQVAVGPDLGDGLLLARGPRGAVVADEDVAGRVERDAGDARETSGSEPLAARAAGGTDEAAGRVDRRAARACGGVKPWLSSSSAQYSMVSIVLGVRKATKPNSFDRPRLVAWIRLRHDGQIPE